MGFWDAATKALPTGYGYGLQSAERAKDRKEREKDRAAAGDRWQKNYDMRKSESEVRIGKDRLSVEIMRQKKAREDAESIYFAGKGRLDMGDQEGAAALANEIFARTPMFKDSFIIVPSSQPEKFQQLIASGQVDPSYQNAGALLVSKRLGIMPFKSMDDVYKQIPNYVSPSGWGKIVSSHYSEISKRNAIAKENAKSEKDGKYYWLKTTIGLDGSEVVQKVPLEGPAPLGDVERKIMDLGIGVDTEAGKKMKKVLYGLQSPEPSEYQKTQSDRAYGLAENADTRADRADVRAQETHEKKMKETGAGITPIQRANLYTKTEKAYRENFSDAMGKVSKDAPDKEKWINETMEMALGLRTGRTPAREPGLPQPEAPVKAKGSISYQQIIAKKIYDEIFGDSKDGNAPDSGKEKPPKPSPEAKWSEKYNSWVMKDKDGNWRKVK